MKLLINICSYDGISTHYCGVGTMIKRYIKSVINYCTNNNIDYHLNLFTVESFEYTLGYNRELYEYHLSLPNTKIYKVTNGSNGETNFGTIINWKVLSENTAQLINNLDTAEYDKIVTLIHDTPYCDLVKTINKSNNHYIVWIPHSTVKIHGYSSDEKKSNYNLDNRYIYEQSAVDYINSNNNLFLGACGDFIGNHMMKEYNLNSKKLLKIFNGELLNEKNDIEDNIINQKLFNEIKNYKEILLSFGRAEEYKNLESTMLLGKEMNIKPIVIAQSYYEGQPIINDYIKLAKKTNTNLYIDVPFSFPHYILNKFHNRIILLIPSKKEIMGLVINEVRKLNKDNIIIVANNIDGLKEQINDTYDGLLVNLNDIKESSQKIKNFLHNDMIIKMNNESQNTLKSQYDFYKNFSEFMNKLLFNKRK